MDDTSLKEYAASSYGVATRLTEGRVMMMVVKMLLLLLLLEDLNYG